MAECEFCGEPVETPSHMVVNGWIFMNSETTCAHCGYDDEELVEWVKEHQPGSLDMVEDNLDE